VSPRFPLRPDPTGEETAERRSGLAVSAALHLALLAFLIVGGPVFDRGDEAQALRLAPVETITAAEFDAMVSSAPEAPTETVRAPLPPGGETAAPAEATSLGLSFPSIETATSDKIALWDVITGNGARSAASKVRRSSVSNLGVRLCSRRDMARSPGGTS